MLPKSWKDFFSKNTNVVSSDGHLWIPQRTKGGRKFVVRRVDSASVETTPTTIFYKCEKCDITAVQYMHEPLVVQDLQYLGLTCDECIIKKIIE